MLALPDDSSVDGAFLDESHNTDSGTGSIQNADTAQGALPCSDPLNSTLNSSRPGSKVSQKSSANKSSRSVDDNFSVPSVHTLTPRNSQRVGSALTSQPIMEETEEELTEAEADITLGAEDFTDGELVSEGLTQRSSRVSKVSGNSGRKSERSLNSIPQPEKCSSPTSQTISVNNVIDQAVDQLFEPMSEPDTGETLHTYNV